MVIMKEISNDKCWNNKTFCNDLLNERLNFCTISQNTSCACRIFVDVKVKFDEMPIGLPTFGKIYDNDLNGLSSTRPLRLNLVSISLCNYLEQKVSIFFDSQPFAIEVSGCALLRTKDFKFPKNLLYKIIKKLLCINFLSDWIIPK